MPTASYFHPLLQPSGTSQPGNISSPEYYAGARQMSPVEGIGTMPQQQMPAPPQLQPITGPATATQPAVQTQPGITPATATQPATDLGPMPDPNAIRRRLVNNVYGTANTDPGVGQPFNADFDQGVSNLYGQSMAQLANYDQQEGQLNTAYEKNRGALLQNQDLETKQLMDRLAFQGILSSGIATDQRALLGQKYGQQLDKIASAKADALSKIASGRLNTQSTYQQQLDQLESGYTKNLSDWVQQQAQQQAAREQYQALEGANANLLAQLNQAQAPPLEATMSYNDLLGSLGQDNIGTFTQPGGFLDKVFQNRANVLTDTGSQMSLQQLVDLVKQARGY